VFVLAMRAYPTPDLLIDRGVSADPAGNEATPPLVVSVVVPDSVPLLGFEFGSMLTVTGTFPVAAEFVMSWPDASRSPTLTGRPPGELKPAVMFAPTTAPVGWPSLVNASEHVPVTAPERFPALAGSIWKLLPGRPLKSFDCLTCIPHLYEPLHGKATVTVTAID